MKQNLRETLYLGWDAPLLPACVQTLLGRFRFDDQIDLDNLLCVLPTARGGNRFGKLLSDAAAKDSLGLKPPTIITTGELPERLYQSSNATALEFEQTLAWSGVLRKSHPDDLKVLVPNLPAEDATGAWLELAGTIRRLHGELSASVLSFADVAAQSETDADKRRWELLAKLADDYQVELDRVGLADPDNARIDAIKQKLCQSDQTIVLVGTSDISDLLLAMLKATRGDVIAMVGAPKSAAKRFDKFGCVNTQRWLDHELPLRDEHLIPADDISDQAIAVAESIAEQRQTSDRVVVGVTDETHVGAVEMELRGNGHSTFRGLGWTVASTTIGRLFDLTSTHLQQKTWRTLAALVRHSHVNHQITEALEVEDSSTWMFELDSMLANHYPTRIDGELPPLAIEKYPLAVEVAKWVDTWLKPFAGGSKKKKQSTQPIAKWCSLISKWLETAPSPLAPDESNRTSMAIRAATQLLERFASLNSSLDLSVTGGLAMEMMAGRLADLRVVGSPSDDDIQIIGWLDLALEDCQAMTIIGFNHPFVPSAVTSDPFLPGSLRSTLRMADNDRRFARDIYATHLVLSTRRNTRFIVGKNGADGSPTPPSRLIAAAPKQDTARRVRHLLEGKRDLQPVIHHWDNGPKLTDLPIPKFNLQEKKKSPTDKIVKVMSVTAFRDYLTCPYRFYLRHVLKLRPLDDEGRELAANQFGDLVHGALEDFGDSPHKGETSTMKIEAALLHYLHAYAEGHYGSDTSMAVSLQITQAERRLKAVAVQQALRIEQGWTIHGTEESVSESAGACIEVPEGKVGIRGRFDRIDFHPQTGRWAILDYKTHGHLPEKKHLKKIDGVETWIDLQLPLYRMMIPHLGIDAPPEEVELGYFNVSEKDEETKINIAQFTPEQMADAESVIQQCVSGILNECFEPTNNRVDFDDYSMILQTGIADRMLDSDEVWGQGE